MNRTIQRRPSVPRPTIYLAGRVTPPPGDWLATKWAVLSRGMHPERATFISSDMPEGPGKLHTCADRRHDWADGRKSIDHVVCYGNERAVDDNFLRLIREADFMVAVIDDQHAHGTAAEIAYAAGLGLPVCVLIVRSSIFAEPLMDDAYWLALSMTGVQVSIALDAQHASDLLTDILDAAISAPERWGVRAR